MELQNSAFSPKSLNFDSSSRYPPAKAEKPLTFVAPIFGLFQKVLDFILPPAVFSNPKKLYLFNIKNDPGEMKNEEGKNPAIVSSLYEKYLMWLKEVEKQ